MLLVASDGKSSDPLPRAARPARSLEARNTPMEPFHCRITDVIGEFEVVTSFPCCVFSASSGSPHKPNAAPPSCASQHAYVKRAPARLYCQLCPHPDGYVSSLGAVLRLTLPRREVAAQNNAEDSAASFDFLSLGGHFQVGVECRKPRPASSDRFSQNPLGGSQYAFSGN